MSHPLYSVCTRRLPPFPGSAADPRRLSANSKERPQTAKLEVNSDHLMKSYLTSHPEILDEYIMEFVPVDRLELWLRTKKEKHIGKDNESTLNIYRPRILDRFLCPDVVAIQEGLLFDAIEKKDLASVLYDMANVICKSINAQNFAVFIPRPSKADLCMVIPNTTSRTKLELKSFCPIEEGGTIAGYVAKTNKVVAAQDTTLFTRHAKEGFSEKEVQTVTAMLSWIGIGIYQSQVNKMLNTQADLNTFLLELTEIIFDDVIVMDKLIQKIMMFTKDLVNADRCSLFLVDSQKQELYANLFDEGEYVDNKPVFVKRDEVRCAMDKGIAGAVATTQQIINIPDAYADPRFNKDIDVMTGYTTTNILSIPIISNGKVIGVVQMLNKKTEGGFTNADVESFRTFSVYSALALHYSKMYHDLVIQMAHHNVASEQLNYHAVCEEKAVNDQLKRPLDEAQIPEDLDKLDFYIEPQQETYMNKLMVRLITNMAQDSAMDIRKLYRFVLTVKKNYRPMPYHNWTHGWHVAHNMFAMFNLIQQSSKSHFVKPLLSSAYIVASLCHDVDHRGYNNQFMILCKDPLAILYETSTMERHHFATSVRILQRDQHNIYSHLSPEDYKVALQHIENGILATDLAVYLKNIKNFSAFISTKEFSLEKEQHRDDVLANMMTAADLCVMVKDWPIHKDVTLALYEEFWNQGDFERLLGKEPIGMMDREKRLELPKNQIGFMEFVCMPCYTSLAVVFPCLSPAVELIKDNLHQWELMLAGKVDSVWEPSKSRLGDA